MILVVIMYTYMYTIYILYFQRTYRFIYIEAVNINIYIPWILYGYIVVIDAIWFFISFDFIQ